MDIAKLNLTRSILTAMGAGIVVGLALYFTGLKDQAFVEKYFLDGALWLAGEIFVRSLQLLVAPLVLVSLVCGTAAMDDVRKLGSIGLKTLGLYLVTTGIAVSMALAVATIVKPGEGFELTQEVNYVAGTAPPFVEVLADMFPKNPFKALADGNMLQIIVFAVLLGIALVISGKPGQRVLSIFQDLNEVIMKLVAVLMLIAPVGVFAKITMVFADTGWDAMQSLGLYFGLVLLVLVMHGTLVYPAFLMVVGKLNPAPFFRKFRSAQMFAFSTASSNATLPITLETVQEKLGVDRKVSSFTIPLGATINMDGTAIMQGVATVFISNVAGIDLSLAQLVAVVVTATLASVGTAGVPGVGLIMLAMVLNQVGLPVEYITLVIGIDRLLDMTRTAVNITGDAAITCIVAKSEGQLDLDTYNAK